MLQDADKLFTDAGDGWFIRVMSDCRNDNYFTLLQIEVDTLPDGSVDNYWEVFTYRLDKDGKLDELVNNTGTIDNYPQALSEYGLHLDLYHGKTLEEVFK